MKYLIAGLGNPGIDYHDTRHNIGFMVLDYLARQRDLTFEGVRNGYMCNLRHKGRQLLLLKPTTYMNLSGKAIRYHLNKHKIPLENLLVITDDIALPLGKLRMRGKGSPGGHNGMKNIQELLGTNQYARLRFGVGANFHQGQQVDFVLSPFEQEEQELLKELIPKAAEMTLSFTTQGIDRTMSQFNN